MTQRNLQFKDCCSLIVCQDRYFQRCIFRSWIIVRFFIIDKLYLLNLHFFLESCSSSYCLKESLQQSHNGWRCRCKKGLFLVNDEATSMQHFIEIFCVNMHKILRLKGPIEHLWHTMQMKKVFLSFSFALLIDSTILKPV